MMKDNKKGNWNAMIELFQMPIIVIFLILICGTFIFMGTSFNDKIQLMDVPTEAKSVSNDISGVNSSVLYYVPAMAIIAGLLISAALMWFATAPDDVLFIFSIIIYLFYTVVLGSFKVMYNNIASTNLLNGIIDNFFLVGIYFDALFIFQAAWFFILFIIWGTK